MYYSVVSTLLVCTQQKAAKQSDMRPALLSSIITAAAAAALCRLFDVTWLFVPRTLFLQVSASLWISVTRTRRRAAARFTLGVA